jgi:hypothetical protein
MVFLTELERRKRQYLDDAVSLIIVHANQKHDPDIYSRKAVQELIDTGFADYIWELNAFHQSLVKHGGVIIDNTKCPGDYHIDELAGNDYVVVGGGLGNCHLGAYIALLSSRFTRRTTIHLPADAIYKTFEKEIEGELVLLSKLVTLSDKEFKNYEKAAKSVFNNQGYAIFRDEKKIISKGDKTLQLMLWSKKDQMLRYIEDKK